LQFAQRHCLIQNQCTRPASVYWQFVLCV